MVVTANQQRFLIDPVSGFIGCIDDSNRKVTIIEPTNQQGERWAIEAFVGRNSDFVCFSGKDSDSLQKHAKDLKDRSIALDLFTLLFDPDIRIETKKRIVTELVELFENPSSLSHVADILFAAPLPSSADISIAGETWLDGVVGQFLMELIDSQPRIRDLFAIWSSMKSDQFVERVGHRLLTGRLVSKSFFSTLVTRLVTQADVDRLGGQLALALKDVCEPRIISKILSEYKKTLSVGIRRQRLNESEVEQQSDDMTRSSRQARVGRPRIHQLYLQAEREVKAIASLFAEGKDSKAYDFLTELLERQLKDSSEYAVKSLCHIASRTSTSGRRDVSFELLKKALVHTDGLDAVLFMQIGNELRSIGQFDKAIECYQRARELDDGTKAAAIRDEIIRTSVAKGEYSDALTQYLQIPADETLPSTLTSLGTLYRKMGDLRSARALYQRALREFGSCNDVAEAGLAEATKQSGKPHQAIVQYKSILERYEKVVEHSSKRIYTLALSQLLRITEQYQPAIDTLNKILKDAPLDQDVNFQLAKVYLLAEDREKSAQCMELAKVSDLSGIASELFRLATQRIGNGRLFEHSATPLALKPFATFLPEERGLAGCRDAIIAITEERYSDVINTLPSIAFVDRIHKDFANVLCYHANRRLNRRYDFRQDRSLCRILKRGFKPLRQVGQLITENEFNLAIDDEFRICMRIA